MKLDNGETLMHGSTPYDPQKAHAYYLRTRRLKGRKGGVGQLPAKTIGGLGDAAKVTHLPAKKKAQKPVDMTTEANKIYLSNVAKQLKELDVKLKAKIRNAQTAKNTFKPDKGAAKAQPDTVESLTAQISDIKGRLTAAVAKLQQLSNPAP